MRRWLLVALLAVAGEAQAEQFLGVDDSGADDSGQPAAPAATKKAPRSRAAAPDRDPSEDDAMGGWLGDDVSVNAGLGVGPTYVDGQVTVDVALNRFMAVDTSYLYYRQDDTSVTGQQYGPEVDLILRYPNKTVVTPYVGAGPGYLKWSRAFDGTVYSQGAEPTANGFGGLILKLNKHFGIQLERRQTAWLGTPPKSFNDRDALEARSAVVTKLGFLLIL